MNNTVIYLIVFSACIGHFVTSARVWSNIWSNIAFRRPATQSSDWSDDSKAQWGDAGRSVDGSRNPSYFYGYSCSHTGYDYQAWWAVDLGQTTYVAYVKISTRDSGALVQNFNVGLTDTDPTAVAPRPGNYDLCAHIQVSLALSSTSTITCNPTVAGRYLVIQLMTTQYLMMCEVEVYQRPSQGNSSSSSNQGLRPAIYK